MNLLNLAIRRASIREFDPNKPPSLDKVLYCIRVALEAPSGLNCQPWRFLIIRDINTKRSIRGICENGEKNFYANIPSKFREWLTKRNFSWRKPFLTEAPYLLLVFSDISCPYFIQSTWLAIGYLLLALEEQGLSSLTYTPPNPNKISKFLNVPKRFRLECIIPIGYKKRDKKKEPRANISEKTYIEEWGKFHIT